MQFLTPNRVIFGREGAKELEKHVKGKTVIVSGENTWKNVKNYVNLEAEVIIFKRNGEPAEEDVEKLAEEIKEAKPDSIVAIGGGSVIDAAKIARVIYEHKPTWEDMYSGKIEPMRSTFVAVESTSGTGTGVSAAAVVKRGEYKAGVVSSHIIPHVAIYDPDLVRSMPREVAIYTGMDALTHAIEAYTSNVENIVSDTLALKAIELIYRNLPVSVNGDKNARELVHYGNMLAGMGFTNSRLGLCHAAAHWIGGIYEVEHGKINAILLPYVVRLNEKYTDKFKEITRVMGVEDVALSIMNLNRELGIPTSFQFRDIDSLSERIAGDRLMNFNPKKFNREEVKKFLIAVEEGDLDAL